MEPRATVTEVPDGDAGRATRRHDRHDAMGAAWEARHGAKSEPAAPFAFAEAAGWVLGPLAVLNTCWPRAAGRLRRALSRRAVPDLPTRMEVGRAADPAGLTLDEQVSVAHAGLTTMGLTSGFAPLVMLCGHRSATTNNPFGAALDCGACAGKAGGPNARALAEVLNRREVRTGLARAGIAIPEHTWFVAAEHETTTDRVSVLDRHRIPGTHRDRLARLERDLAAAGAALAAERRQTLPGAAAGEPATTTVGRRSDDWAEPVPEWGLVGNAAVVVGPRSLTAGVDLQRRVFLHSYDTGADPDGVALEAIMTGPLVVGHWISSQYYFSTVDPRHHGAGTKPLHNVVGGIGVLEGPGGDLRTGLPLESVSFAGRRVHEPLRLLAVVQAPIERIEAVIARNAAVGTLLGNGWVRLVARTEDGWSERLRDGTWTAWPEHPVAPDAGPAERDGPASARLRCRRAGRCARPRCGRAGSRGGAGMGRERLTTMTRVEVVVSGEDAGAVRDLFTAAEATGFTTVSNVSGMGHAGHHEGRLLFNDVDALTLLFTVVPDARADDLVDALGALLEERPGVMFVSSVAVSRPGYFGSP